MKDANSLGRLRELLGQEEKITILVGKDPDLDSMAGALSLYLSLSKAGKTASVVCPTPPIVELSTLVGIDKVAPKLPQEGKDLTMVLPYQKGRIEKISYNIENDKIHLVVKAGEAGLGFETQDIAFYKTGGQEASLFFLVGVQDPQKDLIPPYQEDFLKTAQVVDLSEFKSSPAASTSETVTNLLESLAAPIDIDIAQNLLTGLVFATDNFQNEKTTSLAFEMAARLLRYGAQREGIKLTERVEKTVGPAQAPPDWLTPKIYKGSTLP